MFTVGDVSRGFKTREFGVQVFNPLHTRVVNARSMHGNNILELNSVYKTFSILICY